ncbi:28S ribosomal protein S23, mitochondrial isoform X2 [Hyla sarda]|uniref:28S ribosomal protein S23, mitochondrial isoform X2 n=1 Tax=Hyla sarda TaxID=327740 RepID=UPI0024C345E2|nr:28S ribosomal protein S23, mitochondrial isoform X2 [Hyla sarda]
MCMEITRDLMRAGVIKQNEKPIWYDVYAAFPPKREPTYEKPLNRRNKLPDNVPSILYSEDVIRAKFYETYGSGGIFHLYRKNFKSICQRFVETYTELQKAGGVSEDKLFEETSKALLAEGIILRRTGAIGVSKQQSSVPEGQEESTVKPATE